MIVCAERRSKMTPDIDKIKQLVAQGEGISVEFKSSDARPDSLAREMVAFSNTYGGMLLLGVEDDGTISGIGPHHLEERIANICRHNVAPAIAPLISLITINDLNICVIQISKGAHKPYQTQDGKFWIRVGSTNRQATKEELSRLFQAAGLVHFDIAPVEGTDERDLDAEKLHNYWHTCYDINFLKMNRDEQNNLLRNADILVSYEDTLVAGVGGLLLFGRQPQRRLPQSSIVFAVFRGTEITDELIDKKEVTGTLPELIENTAALVRLFLPRPSEISGLKRQDQETIPVKIIREALVNAVCHRDYSMSTRKTTVYMFEDRLEITSPGVIANSLTLEKIKYGNSAPRNMFLLKYLDNLRYSDGLERGIPMMLKAMGERMILEEIGDLFRITLRYF